MNQSIRKPTGLGVPRWSLRHRRFGVSVTALQDARATSHAPIRFMGSMREVLFRRGETCASVLTA